MSVVKTLDRFPPRVLDRDERRPLASLLAASGSRRRRVCVQKKQKKKSSPISPTMMRALLMLSMPAAMAFVARSVPKVARCQSPRTLQPQPFSAVGMPQTPRTGLRMVAASQDELKKQVGYKAVDDYVKSGMIVGLGTGSTAAFAVERLGQLLKEGTVTDIIGIPTSIRTKEQAEELGIPLATLDEHSKLDVAIDGADEVDPGLNLVKGGGGALLREKMVEVRQLVQRAGTARLWQGEDG
eukprot:scaffold1667_cov258-Pinguiococcus_pyrenoidosus.AAC.17